MVIPLTPTIDGLMLRPAGDIIRGSCARECREYRGCPDRTRTRSVLLGVAGASEKTRMRSPVYATETEKTAGETQKGYTHRAFVDRTETNGDERRRHS